MISELHAEHCERLIAHISAVLGADDTAAEDIAQDVWLWALQLDIPPSWLSLERYANLLIYTERERRSDEADSIGLRFNPAARLLLPDARTAEAAPTATIAASAHPARTLFPVAA